MSSRHRRLHQPRISRRRPNACAWLLSASGDPSQAGRVPSPGHPEPLQKESEQPGADATSPGFPIPPSPGPDSSSVFP